MAEESGEPSDGMTQPSREKPPWWKKLSQTCKAAWRWCKAAWRQCKEWMGGFPLFGAIAVWAFLGIIAFLLAVWCLGGVLVWQLKLDPEKQAESIVKIALTLVGGVGAVAYLVIKYQERQQAGRDEERAKREEDRLVNTKMQDAVDQLGSDRASTRIAGVYALTDVADTCGGGYRQRVVDILCGYLRSDRETYLLGADGKPATDQPKPGDADKAVESTISPLCATICARNEETTKPGNPLCGKRWMMTSYGATARSISMEPHSTKPWTSRIPLSNVSHAFAEPNSNAGRTSVGRPSQATRTSMRRTSQAARTSVGRALQATRPS